jgi:hypothetical protein
MLLTASAPQRHVQDFLDEILLLRGSNTATVKDSLLEGFCFKTLSHHTKIQKVKNRFNAAVQLFANHLQIMYHQGFMFLF